MEERLQKILSSRGICSRRAAEKMILLGDVKVNGKVAELGQKADILKDYIKVNNKLINHPGKDAQEQVIVVAVNKPKGVLPNTSTIEKDPSVTVFDLLRKLKKKNLQPIGRLDVDAEGILLLTNNGTLKNRLSSAKYETPKKFKIKVDALVSDKTIARIKRGIRLNDKTFKVLDVKKIKKATNKTWLLVLTNESKNRLLRKAFESIGHPIDKIKREEFADISCRGLRIGDYRYLNEKEIKKLKEWVGLNS